MYEDAEVELESNNIESGNGKVKDWEEYKEYLKDEKKCGEYEDGDSFEIYNEVIIVTGKQIGRAHV